MTELLSFYVKDIIPVDDFNATAVLALNSYSAEVGSFKLQLIKEHTKQGDVINSPWYFYGSGGQIEIKAGDTLHLVNCLV